MKIYVASSWRNPRQQAVVELLRAQGHEVYDFRNPAPGNIGFSWRQVDPGGFSTPQDYLAKIDHPICNGGFWLDMDALMACDACVLVLPCGRSAHLELGWAVGAGKKTAILLSYDQWEPELMYKMVDLVALQFDEIISWLRTEDELRQARAENVSRSSISAPSGRATQGDAGGGRPGNQSFTPEERSTK